jgi:glycosyltransferase involved in cell wall biosynthesis
MLSPVTHLDTAVNLRAATTVRSLLAVRARARDAKVLWTNLSRRARSLRRRWGKSGPVAIVSNLPPQNTGIANFTRRLFQPEDPDFRIYSDAVTTAHGNGLGSNEPGAGPNVFPIGQLFSHQVAEGFTAIVFMLGNSAHSVACMQALYALARSNRSPALYAYLHEPYLNGLLAPLVGADGFLSALRQSYPERPFPDDAAAPREAPRLLERRILGARALLELVHLEGIFVNSQFALELLRADYPEFPPERITRLFHPVFAPVTTPDDPAGGRPLRIGSFGVPNPFKKLNVLLDAFRRLRARDPQTELILSGYGMAGFIEELGLGGEHGLRVHESPSDEVFEALMASVDVAVQLRSATFGESSGTVSQLVALGRPTIVARIGAFAEFEDAVCFAHDDVSPEELADLIEAEAEQPERRRVAMAAYAATHESGRLLGRLRHEFFGRS